MSTTGPRVRIFDTTLRDGEQAPGCTMTRDEKLQVARQLARLGVDVVEAGFPAASAGDWEAVSAVAEEFRNNDNVIICGLARANYADIDRCWSALESARRKRIHTFLATSDIHLEHKLRMTHEQVIETVGTMVAYARSLADDVEFSPEDACRTNLQFLYHVLRVAIDAGATTLNIPDTVGYITSNEYGALIAGIIQNVVGSSNVVVSTHCHDDLGLAVANSLAGVHAGARQVECTINGIGERAGNASLEEIVMALHTRKSFYQVETGIATREIARTSRLVSMCTGVAVPPNKAIVGANAFAHEAGIHQDGVLKNPLTYEIMDAETVGLAGNTLVLGKHSGRHAFRKHLEHAGHHLSDEELRHAFMRFKEIADKKKVVDDRDIEAIVSGETRRVPVVYAIEQAHVTTGTHMTPTATVTLRGPGGEVRTGSAQGIGPVDAVCRAIDSIVEEPGELVEFTVNAITEGINAVGEVTVRLQERGHLASHGHGGHGHDGAVIHGPSHGHAGVRSHGEGPADAESRITSHGDRRPELFSGYGVNIDIIMAAAEAYVSALNKLLHVREERRRARLTDSSPSFIAAVASDR